MKKFILALALALLVSVSAKAQQPQARFVYANSVVSASPGVLEIGSGVQFHQLTWNVSGSVPTCQVQLDQSADNLTWSSQIIAAQTCTSNGLSAVSTATTANYVRINIVTKSGAGTVTVTYLGYTSNPGGGGSGSLTCATAGAVIFNDTPANTGICSPSYTLTLMTPPAGANLNTVVAADGSIALTATPDGINSSQINFDVDGNIYFFPQLGKALRIPGSTDGSFAMEVGVHGGIPNPWLMPTATGAAGTFLQTDGGNPQTLTWGNPASTNTTKAVYAADPTYGAKFNAHIIFATAVSGNPTLGTLLEMDNSTPYVPTSADVGKYIGCVSAFEVGGTAGILRLAASTILSITATSITASNNASTNGVISCVLGTDDTAALQAAFAAAIVPGNCKVLILPAGRTIISAVPFVNSSATGPCATNIIGQGGGMLGYENIRGGFGTVFTPANNFTVSNGEMILRDVTNMQGELANFAVDGLGFPLTTGSNFDVLELTFGYNHNLSVIGFAPGSATAASLSVIGNKSCLHCTAEANRYGLVIGNATTSVQLTDLTLGNNGTNILCNNSTNVSINSSFMDESSIGAMIQLTGCKNFMINSTTTLATASSFAISIDGTSSVICDQSQIGIGAFAQQAVTISSGGVLRASKCSFYTGNSTTNASIVNNGTYIDLGGNVCSTYTLTANNSGGTIPGACVANAGNALAVLPFTNRVALLTDFTDSTSTTLQLISNGASNELKWTLPTSQPINVSFHCNLLFDQATTAVADSFGIGVTGTAPTQANASGIVYTAAGVSTSGTLTALASTTPTAVVSFTPSAITTVWNAMIDGTIEQPSNATPGVFGIYVATTTGGDNLIVKRGSYCSLF